jgi:hypothetical protein
VSVWVVSVTVSTPPPFEVLVLLEPDFDPDEGFESSPPPHPAAIRAAAANIEISRFIPEQATNLDPAFLRCP